MSYRERQIIDRKPAGTVHGCYQQRHLFLRKTSFQNQFAEYKRLMKKSGSIENIINAREHADRVRTSPDRPEERMRFPEKNRMPGNSYFFTGACLWSRYRDNRRGTVFLYRRLFHPGRNLVCRRTDRGGQLLLVIPDSTPAQPEYVRPDPKDPAELGV